MRILIFGAAGFIGANLCRYLASGGHEVMALSRSGRVPGFSGTCRSWAFDAPVAVETLNGVDCAINLAHDFNGEKGARLTFEATLANVAQLRAAGVRRQLFFSSYSAGEHATSIYGRTKYALEQALADCGDTLIVRPGLVIGNGGIYGRIHAWASRLPIVPLPDGGYGQVPIITMERLCQEVLMLVEAKEPERESNLFEQEYRSLRQLVLEAAAESKRKPWICPLPASWIVWALRMAAALHIPLPVNADNLIGFIANQSARHISTLRI